MNLILYMLDLENTEGAEKIYRVERGNVAHLTSDGLSRIGLS